MSHHGRDPGKKGWGSPETQNKKGGTGRLGGQRPAAGNGPDCSELRAGDSHLQWVWKKLHIRISHKGHTCLCGEGRALVRNYTTDTTSVCFNVLPKK